MKSKNVYIEFILVAVIIILINMIFAKITMRIDLTKSKKYTLSKSTKDIIKDLNDNIWVEFYISKNIPPYLTHLKKQIWDVLSEYRSISKGHVHIREIDPISNPDLKSKLYMYGIQPVNVNIYSKDKAEIIKSYIGMAIFYKDKVESIPVIQSTNDLEYNISSILLKITSPRIPVIGYPQGGSEMFLKQTSKALLGALQKEYKVIPFDLTNKNEYGNLDLVIIPNYKTNMDKHAMYYLDQFILKGGKVAFFVNGVNISYQKESRANQSNIFDFLKSKGITINKNLVNDSSNDIIGFSYGNQRLASAYPLFVKVLNKYMNPKFSFLKKLQNITLPWVSSVNFSRGADLEYDTLLKSTEKAWKSQGFILIDPTQIKAPKDINLYKQFILAGIEHGKFPSYFKKNDLPEGIDHKDFLEKGVKEAKLLAIGTSHILKDNILQRFPNNKIFILNLMDNLLLGNKLSGIRKKNVKDPVIGNISDSKKTIIKWINYILIPLLIIIFGIFRFLKRKKNRNIVEK
ncbi:GldG family protein [bacterium]|nr:GldG family protein [bacterium]